MARSSLNTKARSPRTASSSWLTARRFSVHLAQVARVQVQVDLALLRHVRADPAQVRAVLEQALPVRLLAQAHPRAVLLVRALLAQVLEVRVPVLPVQVRRVPVVLRVAGAPAVLPAVDPWVRAARR